MLIQKYLKTIAVSMLASSCALGAGLDLRFEGGGVWFSRNDVRIPGDEGTRFDMLDLTGRGANTYLRLHATYKINSRHALRLTGAPLEVSGTGELRENISFEGSEFAAATPTKGTYKFNTYRLTYRWTFHDCGRWLWGLGGAALVRDAEITLEQGDLRRSRDDLGLVPLLHLYGQYRFNDRTSLILDAEGAWAPMGRAIDATLSLQRKFESGWYFEVGYRTLEGGADNDEVYTFAWLHHAQVIAGYSF